MLPLRGSGPARSPPSSDPRQEPAALAAVAPLLLLPARLAHGGRGGHEDKGALHRRAPALSRGRRQPPPAPPSAPRRPAPAPGGSPAADAAAPAHAQAAARPPPLPPRS